MKKLMTVLLAGAFVFSSFQFVRTVEAADLVPVTGAPKLAILVDCRKVKFTGGDPFMENNRVQVPLRGIGESLGAKVGYSEKTVTYIKEEKSISLTLGSTVAVVNGENVIMDTVAKAINGRTYVPLRFISENLGESVSWDQVGNWVWIGTKDIPTPEAVGIKPQELEKFRQMINPVSGLYLDMEDAYVFDYDQLPLKVGDRIIYDVWEIKQDGYSGIRVRYSKDKSSIYYLSFKNEGARVRYAIDGMRIKNGDLTYTETYRVDFRRDEDLIGDKNYSKYTIKQADYIGFTGSSPTSMFLMNNPF